MRDAFLHLNQQAYLNLCDKVELGMSNQTNNNKKCSLELVQAITLWTEIKIHSKLFPNLYDHRLLVGDICTSDWLLE